MKDNTRTFHDFLKYLNSKKYMSFSIIKNPKYYSPGKNTTKWTGYDSEETRSFGNLMTK